MHHVCVLPNSLGSTLNPTSPLLLTHGLEGYGDGQEGRALLARIPSNGRLLLTGDRSPTEVPRAQFQAGHVRIRRTDWQGRDRQDVAPLPDANA